MCHPNPAESTRLAQQAFLTEHRSSQLVFLSAICSEGFLAILETLIGRFQQRMSLHSPVQLTDGRASVLPTIHSS